MSLYTEDRLVQATTADYLRDALGWESIYAYDEVFGERGTLGRLSDREVVLTRYLRQKLEAFNPGLPADAYTEALRQITEYSASQTPLLTNQEKYALLKDGVKVSLRNDQGELVKRTLRVFDFNQPTNNHFLAVREFWVKGVLYRRRADIVGFVNGIPLLFMELKNINKDIRAAYDGNLADYKTTIPHLFHHNAFIILANGEKGRMGSLSNRFEHFHEWKRLAEDQTGIVDMQTLLMGVCNQHTFMDIFENFIVFDSCSGRTIKIVAKNHQYLGVNRAITAVETRHQRDGKLGVFWHTQGSGKSYSMVFFTRKVHRKLGGNFTFLICTDRDDLDTQIYKTFTGCGLVDNDRDPCRARSGAHLRELLDTHKAYVFTLVQKFNQAVDPQTPYNTRDDIIVITDEAHRTQYGLLSLNMRNALPQASYMGFTGTPLFKEDEITRRVFGDYLSTYDFQRAVEDRATVPLYYDSRGEKLGIATPDLNERIAQKLEALELNDADIEQRLERELKREYPIITADQRLEQVAKDFVTHYSTAWESGKAMFIGIDKPTCVKMHGLITRFWHERIAELEAALPLAADEQDEAQKRRQIAWMKETIAAVVVSEEQGEVDKFRNLGLDIEPHRQLIKNGFELRDGKRIDLESAFKKQEHPFRIAIVCAMWLTGFDVPSLSHLYIDKPLKAHTLMQAIARANRVFEGKNNGLIIDYCGILKNLREALATFAGEPDGGRAGGASPVDPTQPEEDLLEALAEAIAMVRTFLTERGASLERILTTTGFERNAAIAAAKNAANETDETRKRFEMMGREVLKIFKACINNQGVNAYRTDRDAIKIVYDALQGDREKTDIRDILRELQAVINEAIVVGERPGQYAVDTPYDISKIDFDRLKAEFAKSPTRNTTVQTLKQAIDQKLGRLMAQNPTRTDFQERYEEMIAAYNREKDRLTIEATFEALLEFYQAMDEEAARHVREGLDEESLAIYDLLKKTDLSQGEIEQIKAIAGSLLQVLKAEKLRVERWREKESTRAAVQQTIRDFLYEETTGLPVDRYSEDEVFEKADRVFQHIFRVYPKGPSPDYAQAA
jgi:type I restriction enzyme R subunit